MAKKLQYDVLANAMERGFGKLAAQLEAISAQLSKLDKQKAEPEVRVKTTEARREIGAFATDMQKRLNQAVKALPQNIAVHPDFDAAEFNRIRAQLASLADRRVGIGVSAADASAQVQAFAAQLRTIRDQTADIEVRANIAAAMAALGIVERKADEVDRKDVTVDVNVNTLSFKKAINDIALLGRSLSQLAFVPGIVALIPTIAGLGNAISQTTGVAGLLPGALQTIGVVAGTVALGLSGLENAMENVAGTNEDFRASIGPLTESARAFMVVLRELVPAWVRLQQATQESLFVGLSENLRQLADLYLPNVQAGMRSVAGEINTLVRTWAEWAAGAEVVRDTAAIFENARQFIANITPGFRDFAAALTSIGVVGGQVFAELGIRLSDSAARFREFVERARESGRMREWIQQGIQAVVDLGSVLKNVGGSIRAIFQAADADATPFIQRLRESTEAMREFLTSTQGQAALIAFFASIRGMTEGLAPGIKAIGAAIFDSFIAAAPNLERLAQAIGSLLTTLAPAIPLAVSAFAAIAPVVQALAAMADVLGPIPALLLATVLATRLLSGTQSLLMAPLVAMNTSLQRFGQHMTVAAAGTGTFAAAATRLSGPLAAVSRVMTGFVGFLGGPWGFALLAASAALSLLVGGHQDAARAAAEHQAAIDALADTLHRQTGAVTEATREMVINRLESEGLISAGQRLGISAQTLADAHLGNRDALTQVNQQLLVATDRAVATDSVYQRMRPTLESAGITLRDVSAAVLGGAEAQEQLRQRVAALPPHLMVNNAALMTMIETIRQSLGPIGQIQASIGGLSTDLTMAQDATIRQAAALADLDGGIRNVEGAIRAFSGAIDPLTGELIAGAEGADQLGVALSQVATDATTTALAAGLAAQELGGVEGGARAAAASMGATRAAFTSMAIEAGLSVDAARNLADALGLIPSVAEVQFLLRGADETTQQIGLIAALVEALPAQKSFVVQALTDEAIAALRTLGVEVETLPDGRMQVLLEDSGLLERLAAIKAAGLEIDGTTISWIIELDDGEFQAKLNEAKRQLGELTNPPGGSGGGSGGAGFMVPISLNSAQFDQRLGALLGTLGGLPTQEIEVGADTSLATAAINAAIAFGNSAHTRATHTITDNVAVVSARIGTLNGLATRTTHTVTDNTVATSARIGALNGLNTRTTHTVTDNTVATSARIGALNRLNTRTTHTVSDNVAAVAARIGTLNGRDTRSTHTITVRTVTTGASTGASLGGGSGGGVVRAATGTVLPGYRPGVDSIPALLSPGEAVLVPELVRMLGARTIMAMNRWASGRKGTTWGTGALPRGAGGGLPVAGGGVRGVDIEGLGDRIADRIASTIREQRGITVVGSTDPVETARSVALAIHLSS